MDKINEEKEKIKDLPAKYKGIICIIIAALGFAFMALFVKLAGDLPAIEKAFFRNFVALFVALFIMKKNKIRFTTGEGGLKFLIFRATFGTIGMFCNFYAISKINISDASMLNKLSPFFAILFSIFLLKEKPKVYQVLCVVAAFIGAVFILKPGIDSVTTYPALIGFISGACAGLAYTFLRLCTFKKVPGPVIVFFFSTFSCLACVPYMIFNFVPIDGIQLVYLLLAGVSASVGQIFITKAYTYSPAAEISVYDYSNILFAALLGMIVLGEFPDAFSIIGYAVIIGAGVVMFLINRRRMRSEAEG
ncbi:MAG: DMT family transporter [Lachnospiraceae bacterium]|nr:DMT family transporter [Lachnospiraceae bacterium]